MHSTVLAHAHTHSLVSPHTHSCNNCTLSLTHKTVHSHAYIHALLYSVIHSLFSKAHTLLSSHMYTYLYAHMHSHSLMCSHICMHSHLHCHIHTTLWLVFAHTTCTIAYFLAHIDTHLYSNTHTFTFGTLYAWAHCCSHTGECLCGITHLLHAPRKALQGLKYHTDSADVTAHGPHFIPVFIVLW